MKRKVAFNKEIIETLKRMNTEKEEKEDKLKKMVEHVTFKYFIDFTLFLNMLII